MRAFLAYLLLSGEAVSKRFVAHQIPTTCCFHLDSAGTVTEDVEEDHVGGLHLSGSFQDGAFCLEDGKVQDSVDNQCFIQAPDYKFQCYQRGVVGDTTFAIAPIVNGSSKLVYDGGAGTYLACSHNNGETYEIFSTLKPNTTGCLEVSLVLSEQAGDCPTSSNTTASLPGNGGADSHCGGDVAIGVQGSDPTDDTSQPSVCFVADSAPSLAPVKIGFPAKDASAGTQDTGAIASITAENSTVFHFSIPKDFASSGSKLCALQFRLPFCSALPADYPCFIFTGLEQESVSNSGMIFSRFGDDNNNNNKLPSWNDTALQQVSPGDKNVLGTFACGDSALDSQDIAWLASSVRNFGLQFEQAGTGPSEFKDGVGAFIVQCS